MLGSVRGTGFFSFTCMVLAGCTGALAMQSPDAGSFVAVDAVAPIADAAQGSAEGGPPPWGEGLAPTGVVEGEIEIAEGDHEVSLDDEAGSITFRVDAGLREHVTFFLAFEDTFADVVLEVLRWDGEDAVSLGATDGGRGLRSVAVFDPGDPRTYWARVTTTEPALRATLTVTRVPFQDGIVCLEDCARLLQLPLPIDPSIDGYSVDGSILRYQYGRRDLVMFVRYAGQRVTSLAMSPFLVGDLSQWNGLTPGTDTGYLRHGSHDRGKDVDLALYGTDGRAVWRSFCETVALPEGGRECVDGTVRGYDEVANAIFFGALFESGRVSQSFLDRELIPPTIDGAEEAAAIGLVSSSVLPLYSSGRQLQHWRNHHNHIHVRVSEEEAHPSAFAWEPDDAPFAGP
jgi:hypothetical protein